MGDLLDGYAPNGTWDEMYAGAGEPRDHCSDLHEALTVLSRFVHLGLALLRASGIPARYASGYLFPLDEAEIGASVEGQSHAWLEAWVGDWCPMDPTTAMRVAERHVLVARGRDYADVPPLKGVYNGSPARSLEVSVGLTRVA